jgi:hypothetical protein
VEESRFDSGMRVRRAVLGDEHFIAKYNVPVKVGVSLSLLTSDLTMSDRQSKKRRWFSYKISYNRESLEDQLTITL